MADGRDEVESLRPDASLTMSSVRLLASSPDARTRQTHRQHPSNAAQGVRVGADDALLPASVRKLSYFARIGSFTARQFSRGQRCLVNLSSRTLLHGCRIDAALRGSSGKEILSRRIFLIELGVRLSRIPCTGWLSGPPISPDGQIQFNKCTSL